MIKEGAAYYSVVIPWVPRAHASPWHPTEKEGPFSTLTRGAFRSWAEAKHWAASHLGGTPYTIVKTEATKEG